MFAVCLSSILPGHAYSNSRTLLAGRFGLRMRQTGKASCLVLSGRHRLAANLASPVGQQPARPDTVAALRFSLPLQVYANFSVCGLNSILCDPVGFVLGQTAQPIECAGFVRLCRAS